MQSYYLFQCTPKSFSFFVRLAMATETETDYASLRFVKMCLSFCIHHLDCPVTSFLRRYYLQFFGVYLARFNLNVCLADIFGDFNNLHVRLTDIF